MVDNKSDSVIATSQELRFESINPQIIFYGSLLFIQVMTYNNLEKNATWLRLDYVMHMIRVSREVQVGAYGALKSITPYGYCLRSWVN